MNENNDLCYCIVCRKSTEFDSIVVKTVSPKNCLPQKLCNFGQKLWTENMVVKLGDGLLSRSKAHFYLRHHQAMTPIPSFFIAFQ